MCGLANPTGTVFTELHFLIRYGLTTEVQCLYIVYMASYVYSLLGVLTDKAPSSSLKDPELDSGTQGWSLRTYESLPAEPRAFHLLCQPTNDQELTAMDMTEGGSLKPMLGSLAL